MAVTGGSTPKAFPGSHVIVKTNGDELPDRTYEEAAKLAAHYSKGSGQRRWKLTIQ